MASQEIPSSIMGGAEFGASRMPATDGGIREWKGGEGMAWIAKKLPSVRQTNLTKRMREVLKVADLEHNRINNVPMSTMHGLEARGLISSEWRMAPFRRVQQTTSGGSFPEYSGVPLTADGVRAARTIQGLPGNV